MLLMNEIACLNSNIYCMQEVQHDHFLSFYEPLFHQSEFSTLPTTLTLSPSVGFKCVYTRRGGIDKVDGCLLAYKAEIFTELHFEHIYYNYRCVNFDRDNVGE